jgi:SAM-dependent methyltransferase
VCEPIAETQRTYDLITAEFARRNATVQQHVINHADTLTSSLPAGSLVADVGCGPGQAVRLLRQRPLRVIGLDLSIGQLRTSELPAVVQADMRNLPLRTGSVDAVWCQAALLHLPRATVPGVLDEFARVLRPGGELYLSVAEGNGEGFEVASNYRSERLRWFTYYREPELTTLLANAGFTVYLTSRNQAHRDWLSIHARLADADRQWVDLP